MSFIANSINGEENSDHCNNILMILDELFSTDGPHEVSRHNTTISIDRPLPSSVLASTTNSVMKYNDVCEDSETIKKLFGWEIYGECKIPFIVRIINGEHLHYVSKRIIDAWIIRYYLKSLDPIFFLCIWMNSYPISISEANLFNEINIDHSDQMYGKEPFEANKDHVYNADDIHEFYTFINFCYRKLMYNTPFGNNEKCGFLRMNTGSIVPYCIIDDQKHVPLLFFDEALEIIIDGCFKIENWNLAYIKFCCIVQNFRNDIIASKSCLVTRLSVIRNFLPPNTDFEEYWPRMENNTLLHTNWRENISSPSTSASLMFANTLLTCIYKKECPTNQIDSTINQHSNNLMEHIENIPLPPIINENGTLTLDKCYPNSEYNIEPIMAMSNCMANDCVMSHVDQIGYIQQQEPHDHQQQPDNNYYQEQNYLQQQQFVQKSYISGNSLMYRSNIPVAKTLVDPTTSETIDLTLPLPRPPLSQSIINTNAENFVLEKIPELRSYVPNSTAYKISFENLYGTIIHCINSIPYVNGHLLMMIDQLVDTVPLPYSTKTCANILYNNMKITLFKANSDQIAILSRYRRLSFLLPEDTPMAMLKDVNSVYQKCFVNISNEEREQYFLSKRQRLL